MTTAPVNDSTRAQFRQSSAWRERCCQRLRGLASPNLVRTVRTLVGAVVAENDDAASSLYPHAKRNEHDQLALICRKFGQKATAERARTRTSCEGTAPVSCVMGSAMPADDQLTRWIDGLGGRLSTGHVADIPPIDLSDGTWRLQGKTMIRIMLAGLNNPHGSASRDRGWRQARLWFLRGAFRRHLARIG
jgi:hypothetical protein